MAIDSGGFHRVVGVLEGACRAQKLDLSAEIENAVDARQYMIIWNELPERRYRAFAGKPKFPAGYEVFRRDSPTRHRMMMTIPGEFFAQLLKEATNGSYRRR